MAKEDRNGCLHSEANGRFIRKTDAEKRKDAEKVYNTHGHLNETEQEAAPLTQDEKVSSSIEYALPQGLLQKRDYRSKFSLMAPDPQTAEKFYGIAKEILGHRGGTNGEDIYLYDPISGETGKGINSETAYHPEYDDKLKRWISNHSSGLSAFHNHAKSSPPSFDDITTALYRRYSKGFVLCHNGTIYEYSAPKKEITQERFDEILRYNDLVTASEIFSRDFGFYIKEVNPNAKKRKRAHYKNP